MTRKIPPFPEEYFHEGAHSICVKDAKYIRGSRATKERGIWTAGINEKPDHTAYWIGDEKVIAAYLITKPFRLPGLTGLEAVRGWVTKPLRKTGCFVELMLTAAGNQSLVADQDGMTEEAHMSWLNAHGFNPRYYDKVDQRLVAVSAVPEAERFHERDSRWLLVLTPMTRTCWQRSYLTVRKRMQRFMSGAGYRL
jgi:hypothetical protein